MENQQLTVTVGIVTYNSRNNIDDCLSRLQQQTYSDLEIVILDNASSDETADWIAENWSNCTLIRSQHNLGFGKGHNRIISATSNTYYIPLNPDVVLNSNYIEEMIKVIKTSADIGWVTGKLYLTQDESEARNHSSKTIYTVGHAVLRDGYAFNIGYQRQDSERYSTTREVFGANGAAPLYKREMLEDIQFKPGEYFDESIFLYHEDVDLDWRARLLGWRCIFTPNAVGYHTQGASGGASVRFVREQLTAVRYYSIFKHAFLFDLLTYNLPNFILHTTFMFLAEPKRGWASLRFMLSHIGEIRRKRRWLAAHRKITRRELQAWYIWSQQQGQEKSYGYIARFIRGRILRDLVGRG